MNDQYWLERATVFELGLCVFHNRPVRIEARDQLDGSRLWVVKMQEWVLGSDAEWHWEPLPSSRSDEFVKLTRFDTRDAAHNFWCSNVNRAQKLKVEVD